MKNLGSKKSIVAFCLLIGIILVTLLSDDLNIFNKHVVEAINVVETLDIMGANNPINLALNEEINLIKLEESRKIQEKLREEERIRKALDEKAQKEAEELAELKRLKDEEEKEKTRKVAYLTFDDGPSKEITPKILDILKEYNIKATFFVIGKMANLYPEVLIRIKEEGHKIGNHTYSHNYSYIYKSYTNFLNDIKKAEETFKKILGEDFETKTIRFPGGSFDVYKANIRKEISDEGYFYFDWNSLNGDAEGVGLSKERLISRFKSTIKNNRELIILMHDTDSKNTTVESLKEIIDHLISLGYEFRILDENYKKLGK